MSTNIRRFWLPFDHMSRFEVLVSSELDDVLQVHSYSVVSCYANKAYSYKCTSRFEVLPPDFL